MYISSIVILDGIFTIYCFIAVALIVRGLKQLKYDMI